MCSATGVGEGAVGRRSWPENVPELSKAAGVLPAPSRPLRWLPGF